MAHAVSLYARCCALLVVCLAGCYAPQPMLVAPSVSDWQAARSGESESPDAEPVAKEWTAAAMVSRAMDRNPDLLNWSARVDAASSSIDAAGAFDDLEVRMTRVELEDFRDEEPLFDLALRGRPPRPGDIASREDAARLRVEELAARRDDARRRLRARVRRLHAVLVFCEREAELLSTEEGLRRAHYELERARMSQGATNKLDVVLAELEQAQVQDALHGVEVRRLRAEGTLRSLLDLSADQPMAPAGAPGGIAEDDLALMPAEREAWVAEGLQTRAALRETTAALGRARADAHRADSELWPWLSWVELSYELSEKSTPMSWGFALAVDLPIFAWTGAETEAADALTRQRAQEHQGSITRVAREVEGAFAAERGAQARLETLRGTLTSAVAGAADAAAASRPPQVPQASVRLRLEVATLRAKRRELEALSAWVTARLNLHATVGR